MLGWAQCFPSNLLSEVLFHAGKGLAAMEATCKDLQQLIVTGAAQCMQPQVI